MSERTFWILLICCGGVLVFCGYMTDARINRQSANILLICREVTHQPCYSGHSDPWKVLQ